MSSVLFLDASHLANATTTNAISATNGQRPRMHQKRLHECCDCFQRLGGRILLERMCHYALSRRLQQLDTRTVKRSSKFRRLKEFQ